MKKPDQFRLRMLLLATLTLSVIACGGGGGGGTTTAEGPQTCVLGSGSLDSCTLN